jgi:hypothetical protein
VLLRIYKGTPTLIKATGEHTEFLAGEFELIEELRQRISRIFQMRRASSKMQCESLCIFLHRFAGGGSQPFTPDLEAHIHTDTGSKSSRLVVWVG